LSISDTHAHTHTHTHTHNTQTYTHTHTILTLKHTQKWSGGGWGRGETEGRPPTGGTVGGMDSPHVDIDTKEGARVGYDNRHRKVEGLGFRV
jgi:hypothetical protein